MEAERTLQHKLSEHEELQSRLEEVRSELAHTKREEKELRSKDVCFIFFKFFYWEAMVADGLDCSAWTRRRLVAWSKRYQGLTSN